MRDFKVGDLVRVQVESDVPVEGYDDLSYNTMVWGIIRSTTRSGKYFVEFSRETDATKYYHLNPFPADVILQRGRQSGSN